VDDLVGGEKSGWVEERRDELGRDLGREKKNRQACLRTGLLKKKEWVLLDKKGRFFGEEKKKGNCPTGPAFPTEKKDNAALQGKKERFAGVGGGKLRHRKGKKCPFRFTERDDLFWRKRDGRTSKTCLNGGKRRSRLKGRGAASVAGKGGKAI